MTTTRRPKGSPKPFRRKDGRFCVGYTPPGGKRMAIYGRTRAECVEKFEAAKRARARGERLTRDTTKLSDYLAAWLERRRSEVRFSTWDNYRAVVHKWLVPTLGAVRLGDLDATDIDRLHREMTGRGASSSLIGKVRRILASALADAERRKLIDHSPSRQVRMPKVPRRQTTPLSTEQMRAFLAAAPSDPHGLLWIVLALSGLRISEALGLMWGDIDWNTGTVQIVRQMLRVPGGITLGETKTAGSTRAIVLPRFALEALREHWHPENTGLLFAAPNGKPLYPVIVRAWLAAFCAEKGLPHLTPHELRHGYATSLIVAGVPAAIVAAQLGHSRSSITLDLYTHVRGQLQQVAADAMQRLIDG